MLAAVWQVSPYLTRTNQFTVSRSLFGPFSIQSFISFVLPFPTVKAPEFFDTDQSMANAYIGLPVLLLALLTAVRKKEKELKILFWFGLFCLAAAAGAALPVREFLFNYVPGMNLFRFPSVFRLFTIIAFILCAASWLNSYSEVADSNRLDSLRKAAWCVVVILVLVIAAARMNGYLQMGDFIRHHVLRYEPETTSISQHIVFQSAIQIAVLLLLILLIKKVENKRRFFQLFALLVAGDMMLAAQLNAPCSVFSSVSAKEADQHIAKFPSGFPMLKDQAVADVNPHEVYFGPFWKNVNIFQKQVSDDGFNSFALTNYETIRDAHPLLYEATLKNKIVFLADTVLNNDRVPSLEKDSAFTKGMAFLDNEDFLKSDKVGAKENGDTAFLAAFQPDRFTVFVRASSPRLLCLLQNNYIGWKVTVNGTETSLFNLNYSLMATDIPDGKSIVVFSYDNPLVRNAFIISASAFIACVLLLLYSSFRK
jgi:hypothetical protein